VVKNISERVQVVEGDITRLDVDAVVNSANKGLKPGGGVCGAIHDAAGPELAAACRRLAPCPTGTARLTKGYELRAKYVIHTVGPRYRDGRHGEAELLRSCYEEALRLAAETGVRTIAFPSISTGIFGYPPTEACPIAVAAVVSWLRKDDLPERVFFCCFSADAAALYRRQLDEAP
jgi:O-acetyl-ADP-ribose deacetylase (regulator of RNase III)